MTNQKSINGAIILLTLVIAVNIQATPSAAAEFKFDANTPRRVNTERWENLMAPRRSDLEPDPAFLDSIKLTVKQHDRVRFDYDAGNWQLDDLINWSVEDRRNMSREAAATGSVEILGLATAMLTGPPTALKVQKYGAPEAKVGLKFFNPDLSPMSEPLIEKLAPEETDRFTHTNFNKHKFRIYYRVKGLDSPRVIAVNMYDRRTHFSINRGYSQQKSGSVDYVDFDIACWRPVPLDVVFNIYHGPDQTREVNPVDGARAEFDDVHVRMLSMVRGHQDMSQYLTSRLVPYQTPTYFDVIIAPVKDRENVLIFHAISPACRRHLISFEMLDAAGKVTGTAFDLVRGAMLTIDVANVFDVPLDQIDKVRVIYRPFARRVVLPLDQLPGQPEINKKITDLCDVTIPYITFEHSEDMKEAFRFLLNLNKIDVPMSHENLIVPLDFPRTYRDATVKEMFSDWLDQYKKYDVDYDEDEGSIKIMLRETFQQKFDKFLKTARKVFPL